MSFKKFIVLLLSVVSAMAVLMLASCKKDPEPTPDSGETSNQTDVTSESSEIDMPEKDDSVMISGKTFQIKGMDMTIKCSVDDNVFNVDYLATNENEEDYMEKSSSFPLPTEFKIKYAGKKAEWIFKSADWYCEPENEHFLSGVTVTYEDEDIGLILRVNVFGRMGIAGPFEFVTTIENKNEKDVRTIPGNFASFDFKAIANEKLLYVSRESGWAEGFTDANGVCFNGDGTYDKTISKGFNKTVFATVFQNANSSGFIPMVYMHKASAGGKYVALQWTSGNIKVKCDGETTSVFVNMDGIAKDGGDFSTVIPSNDTFIFPSVYLGAFDGDVDDGSNEFKRFFFNCKSPANLRDNPQEPFSQMDMQFGIETFGVEMIKWDYGWWSNEKCGDWNNLEGSWKLRNDGYKGVLKGYGCSTLARFGKLLEAGDVKWSVYVLLHDTISSINNPTDTEGEFNSKTHPEWFSNRNVATGMGNSADLGNVECVEYLQKQMEKFFTTNHIQGWRSDFEPICYYSDKQNRHDANGTDVQYWATVGFTELVSYLIDNVEGFRYENCSSGGSIKDLQIATLATMIQLDDVSNYLSARMAFYDSSYCIPACQLELICNHDMGNPSKDTFWPRPSQGSMSDADFKKAMLDMEFRSQILGVPCFSSWTGTNLSSYYQKYTSIYAEKLRPLIKYGSLYHVLPRPDGTHWDGVMYADKDSDNEIKGCLIVFKPSPEAGNEITVKLDGLYADRMYDLSFDDHPELNCTVKGSSLIGSGIKIIINESVGSDMVWITESK